MITTFGTLPTRWWQKWKGRPEFVLEDGSWNPKCEALQSTIGWSLNERMGELSHRKTMSECGGRAAERPLRPLSLFEKGEMEALTQLLSAMLKYCDGLISLALTSRSQPQKGTNGRPTGLPASVLYREGYGP
ncbi:hypothetical protein BDV12DRAFT_108848 [Aspergillus spectabilis]